MINGTGRLTGALGPNKAATDAVNLEQARHSRRSHKPIPRPFEGSGQGSTERRRGSKQSKRLAPKATRSPETRRIMPPDVKGEVMKHEGRENPLRALTRRILDRTVLDLVRQWPNLSSIASNH